VTLRTWKVLGMFIASPAWMPILVIGVILFGGGYIVWSICEAMVDQSE